MSTPWPRPDDDPRRFLHPETIARISRLDLRARQVVEGFISGMHRSPFFGHSVEFVQHREYTAGDDIRHLDWKVWSKTDRFYIKQYEAETNLRCTWSWTSANSMHYGRGPLEQVQLRLHHRRLPGLHAAAPAGRGRPDHVRRGRAPDHARPQPAHAHRRHRQGDGRQPAARQDRHREDPPPRRREHPEPRHGGADLRLAGRSRAAASAAWRCCGTAGTTSSSSTSWTRTS